MVSAGLLAGIIVAIVAVVAIPTVILSCCCRCRCDEDRGHADDDRSMNFSISSFVGGGEKRCPSRTPKSSFSSASDKRCRSPSPTISLKHVFPRKDVPLHDRRRGKKEPPFVLPVLSPVSSTLVYSLQSSRNLTVEQAYRLFLLQDPRTTDPDFGEFVNADDSGFF